MYYIQWLLIITLSEEDVKDILLSWDTSKATGKEKLSTEFLK